MKQALYDPKNIGHFGLASAAYLHFTSPIRRYPDLMVHRLIDQATNGVKLGPRAREEIAAYLQEAAAHSSARERLAMEAEREMVDLKKAQFMTSKIGEVHAGVIANLTTFGFFVELDRWFVEGLVSLKSLGDDFYRYDETAYLIKGENHGRTFRMGDAVTVRVVRVKVFQGEIDFELAQPGSVPTGVSGP
jgi:ribonuclease R